ncbi:MAG: Bax inhibitor-1/YccA family protein [Patescibacteria group bacterium]
MQQTLSQFFAKIYGWTFLGLTVSGMTALWINSMPGIQYTLYTNNWIWWGCIAFELFLVFWLVARLNTMSAGTARGFYFLYSAVNGITLSIIFVTYDLGTISTALFTAAGMFIIMSAIGMFTKVDLSNMGGILLMGLIGVILASVVNIFFVQSSTFDFVLAIITVIVFTLLTAYDTQKLKNYHAQAGDTEEENSKMVTIGALELYLDFINIFLSLLRIFGRD